VVHVIEPGLERPSRSGTSFIANGVKVIAWHVQLPTEGASERGIPGTGPSHDVDALYLSHMSHYRDG
jgi:hypothetical protein